MGERFGLLPLIDFSRMSASFPFAAESAKMFCVLIITKYSDYLKCADFTLSADFSTTASYSSPIRHRSHRAVFFRQKKKAGSSPALD
jgi:hypothetical protein